MKCFIVKLSRDERQHAPMVTEGDCGYVDTKWPKSYQILPHTMLHKNARMYKVNWGTIPLLLVPC